MKESVFRIGFISGSGTLGRLTYFSDYKGYKSSNPVISDDGRFMAFQLAKASDLAGIGYGIFIMDLQMAEKDFQLVLPLQISQKARIFQSKKQLKMSGELTQMYLLIKTGRLICIGQWGKYSWQS